MHCKTTIYALLTGLFVFLSGWVSAQEEGDKGARPSIDSAMAISPDYLPTRTAPMPTIEFYPLSYSTIDTTLLHISVYDPLLYNRNLYQSSASTDRRTRTCSSTSAIP